MALDQGYMLWNADNFSGSCFMAAVELPARGFAGGYPGGAGRSAVIRGSDVFAQLESGRAVSSPEKLTGNLDILPAKVSNVPLREGDVYWATSSGGGGLGDPFHRPPEQVERDLRDARITRSAAEELYGVVMTAGDGTIAVDANATWDNRDQVRQALVPTKKCKLKEVAGTSGFNSAIVDRDQWKCGHCNAGLGSVEQDWKADLAPRRRSLADLFDKVQTQVRRRRHQPVTVAERYCPDCASCLSVDIEVEEAERTPPGFTFRSPAPRAAG
jgi:N-methylhydantoinase B